MEERIYLIMSKNGKQVAEHDITNTNFKELLVLVGIQKEYGRTCSVKRVSGYGCQVDTGINVNDYLKGRV